MSWKAFIFGVVSYYIFTGVFGMSFLGSFILSLICTAIITDIVIASNKSDDKEKNDHDENMSKKCPNCGHEIQDGDTFCIHCGYKLAQNQKKEPIKNNDKSGSLKEKRQPKKSMKVLEASSENIHKEQTQGFWKKKSFWGLIVVIAIGVLVIKIHALPKGYSDPTDVIEYCMRRDTGLNMFQNASLNEEASEVFGTDDEDTDRFQLLQNEKTKRYVFRYSFHGKSIPSYVIATEVNNGDYALTIVPVKKNHIASISKTDVSESYVDKYFPSEKYVGYSIDDLEDMDVKLDKHIHYVPGNNKTLVFYDESENE